MIIDEPKDSSVEDIISGLTGSGNYRAVLITCPAQDTRKNYTQELSRHYLNREPGSFQVVIDGNKIKKPNDFVSEFGRNLRTKTAAQPADLSNFALSMGKCSSFDSSQTNTDDKSEKIQMDLAQALASNFDALCKKSISSNSPTLFFVLENISSLSEASLNWFSECLNQTIRNFSCFQNTRFIFFR